MGSETLHVELAGYRRSIRGARSLQKMGDGKPIAVVVEEGGVLFGGNREQRGKRSLAVILVPHQGEQSRGVG